MSTAVDLSHLRTWIGREQVAEDVVSPSLVDRFNATLDRPAEPARIGEAAPRLIHFCLCVDAVPGSKLGPDGHPQRGDFLPPVPLPRRMWASSTLRFHRDICVDDTVRRDSRVVSVELKQGKGGELCFVEVDHRISAAGVLAVTERQTLVYRQPPTTSRATSGEAAPRGVQMASLDPSPPLLLRYSALTFNAHRIHYDLPYATGEEGYPGLVIHGPLQATLLFHFAAQCNGGRAPDGFAFRGLAPAFAGTPLELHAGAPAQGRMELWSAAAGGPLAMAATAEWQ